jgi:glucoamylase
VRVNETFDEWLGRQYLHSRDEMLKSISRTDLTKWRPGFGQQMRAARGSILASPVLADWNPEPDYFFHWFRDSALVMDALRLLYEDGSVGAEALVHLEDFVRFSSGLRELDGRSLLRDAGWRSGVTDAFQRFLRQDTEFAAVHGDAVIAETRVNPDGTLDISRWTRPQHDGAPLRALALLRWAGGASLGAPLAAQLSELLRGDLAFVLAHWREPAFDMWEEDSGQHYHTLCVSAAALEAGAAWLERNLEDAAADLRDAQAWRIAAQQIRMLLANFWRADPGFYVSRAAPDGASSPKDLDISVIFAAIHAWESHSRADKRAHTVADVRMHATLERLVALFGECYAINRGRAGPAMGRYQGDKYFSGGAFYFSTLGASEFCFRAAACCTTGQGQTSAQTWRRRGDEFLETVRTFTPPSGDLSEQFDQQTGRQTSARHLAWSYAAFISCVAARREALAGTAA